MQYAKRRKRKHCIISACMLKTFESCQKCFHSKIPGSCRIVKRRPSKRSNPFSSTPRLACTICNQNMTFKSMCHIFQLLLYGMHRSAALETKSLEIVKRLS